jgi:hypothetical protein
MARLPGISRLLTYLGTRRYNKAVKALTGPAMRSAGIKTMPDTNTMLILRRTINGWAEMPLPIERRIQLLMAGVSPEAYRALEEDSLDDETLATMAALHGTLEMTPDEMFWYPSVVGYVEEFMVKADYLRDPQMLELLIGNRK